MDSYHGYDGKTCNKISNDIDSAEQASKAEELVEKRDLALKNSRSEASQIIDRAKKMENNKRLIL